MDIKARTKSDTLMYKNILDTKSASKMPAGTILRITGIKPYGIKSYYVTNDGYIECNSVEIVRDEEFYYENYSSKNFQKNNLFMIGAKNLSNAFDIITTDMAPMYLDLQLFANEEESAGSDESGEEGKTIIVPANYKTNSVLYSPPTSGGGFSGGIISTTNPATASNNIYDTSINSVIGMKSDGSGRLLDNISIGSLFDGSFLEQVSTNLFDMIAGFFGNKLGFVIGFDFGALCLDGGSNNWLSFLNGSSGRSPTWTGSVGDTISRPDVYITYYGTGGSVIPSQYEQRQLPLTRVNPAFEQYFRTYGYYIPTEGDLVSSRSLDRIAESRYGFMADYHTGTASPTKPSEEVQFFNNISNADFSKINTSLLDNIYEELNLHVDRKTTFTKFNRYRVPTPDNELGNTRGHIFFTRPDMNLSGEHETFAGGNRTFINHYSQMSLLFDNMNKAHSVLMSYLQGKAAPTYDNMIPILSHCCTGIDLADEILETVEAHESFTGWKIIYGKSNVKSKTAGTINLAFYDDNMLSVYKILKVWTEYISAVYRGEIKPKPEYGEKRILDYAISIYYFLCKENDEDILFWSKYTGCFPTSAPASNFADTIDRHIERPSYTVNFSYAKKSDYNPVDIYEFNQLTSSKEYFYLPTYNKQTFHLNKSFVGAPFVDTMDGTHLFKLRFREN